MAKKDKKLKSLNDKINGWFDFFSDNIELYNINVAFNEGPGQWSPDEIAYYSENNRVMITENQLNKHTTQIVGEQLKTTPEMQIVVDTDQANQKTISLRQDILHTIQVKNNVKECYEIGFECALKGGFGALYYYVDYEDKMSFNQELKQAPIHDPTLCFWDPKATEKTKGDGDYCGKISFMRKKDFERKYPGVPTNGESWNTSVIDPSSYIPSGEENEEMVSIAEIYEKRYTRKKLFVVSPTLSGEETEVVPKDEFKEYVAKYIESKTMLNELLGIEGVIEEPRVVDERDWDDYTIECTRLVKNQILEEYDFPSKILPIPYIDGYSYQSQGKQIIKSFTQDAHDAQRKLNYITSEIAQNIKTYQRTQTWVSNKMVDGSLNQLKNPEKPMAVVKFNPDPLLAGGGPIFRDAKPFPPELIAAYQESKQAIADILGRSDASQGVPGTATSGLQESLQTQQQNTRVNKWFDGLIKAIEHGATLANEVINNRYDQPREMLLIKEDNKSYKTKLNHYNPETNEVENEITKEDYAIRVSVGANYEMMRQIERAWLGELMNMSQNPLFGKVGHLYAQLSDTPIMPKVVAAIKTMIDPQVIAQEEGKPPPPPPPPAPQVMLEQQKLQNEQQMAQVKQLQSQVDLLKAKMQFVENMANAQAKGVQANAEVQKAQIEFSKDIAQTNLDHIGHGVQALGHLKDLAGIMNPPQQGLAEQGGQQ